ncbi:MAG: TetR/AcrR family transcriptional regulator [Chloroflexi bacterium]|nr:TetR/AcrR family transcriptional regulator [Chloroflexota bacterium]
MGGFRERVRLVREEEIVRSAQHLMSVKGYHGMSMDEVADEVGISKATLYQHFDSKEELVANVVERHMKRMLEVLERSDAETPSPIRRLEEALRLLLELRYSRVTPDLTAPDFCALVQSRPALAQKHARVLGRMTELVERAKVIGELRPEIDTRVVVRAFFALVVGPGSDALIAEPGLSIEKIADSTVTLFLRGVEVLACG